MTSLYITGHSESTTKYHRNQTYLTKPQFNLSQFIGALKSNTENKKGHGRKLLQLNVRHINQKLRLSATEAIDLQCFISFCLSGGYPFPDKILLHSFILD